MIKGIVIKELLEYTDKRGWLTEIYRKDYDNFNVAMSYVSYTKFNVARGPHEHLKQSDFFVFIGPGDFELYLWDNRKDSETYKENIKLIVGESNKVSVLVPPGVVHGYKSISEKGSLCINLPDKLFKEENKEEEVDEVRYENNPDSEFKIK